MANYLSPIGNEAQIDSNGDPLNGGQIFTYQAGTSTLATTYTDEGVAQANPIVLNANGLPANAIWLEGGTAYKFVVKDADDVTIRTVDDITGVNDPDVAGTVTEWTTYTATPTYISATSFSVAGDQTNIFQVSRRLRSTNTGGTIYSSITASAYDNGTALTTVTVTNDSGSLDSGLSAVAYGFLSVTNPSFPRASSTEAQAGTSNSVLLTPSTLKNAQIVLGTLTASTSGTAIDFTGIPSWAKRVKVYFDQLSLSGTSAFLVQLGDSGGVETTGYNSTAAIDNGGTLQNSTIGFQLATTGAASTVLWRGALTLDLIGSNTWIGTSTLTRDGGAMYSSGRKQTSATLDRIRITTVNGTDTFDAGQVNVSWE